jgi:hypothetical protein
MDSVVLHHARIDEILKWTKEHLDAYFASAYLIIDQRDERGKFLSFLGCIAVCIVDRESYGSDRRSVLVLIGIFKLFLIFLLRNISLALALLLQTYGFALAGHSSGARVVDANPNIQFH